MGLQKDVAWPAAMLHSRDGQPYGIQRADGVPGSGIKPEDEELYVSVGKTTGLR